ncbi:MAG TPA: type II toxin-antitoxin system RelE/ParE family toxin [Sulfurimonas sp.]|nr:type II toxin-antitoxin system RelE/ParE family toxin [Sulfurimonas sp.]
MNILCTALYEKQLKVILEEYIKENYEATKKFKLYLDTILINLPTKVNKYKKAQLFDNEDIKEIPHEDFNILFFIDKISENYLILAILPKD